jgi:Fur family transcriptional regulator, ferric uptake regulator
MPNPSEANDEAPPAALGQRQTRQRDTIVEVIRGSAGPLTVGEILERAQEQVPGLGVATVYRTVKLLLEGKQIQTVILPSGETRYESTGLGHHHHFHCRTCQEVFDLESCPVQVPRGSYEGGYVVEDHELTLYGTCPACAA